MSKTRRAIWWVLGASLMIVAYPLMLIRIALPDSWEWPSMFALPYFIAWYLIRGGEID